jgi:hypothetical protein
MSKGPTHIFVLVEDKEQQNLVRHFITRSGLSTPRFEPLPNGRGSGEQYVRRKFPDLLKKVGSSLGHSVSAIAIVMIDADAATVPAKRAQLVGQQNSPSDLVLLIPKRNVETWIGALNGHTVDEQTNYKRQYSDAALIKQAAGTLYDWTRPNIQIPTSSPPSLIASIPEWQKIR